MGFVDQTHELWKEFSGIVGEEGLELYDLEVSPGSLKVVLWAIQGNGVTSGDCSKVCRKLMNFCLTEGVRLGVGAEPEIDVSSPGLDRMLRLPRHFEGAVGKIIKVFPMTTAPWAEVNGKPLVGVLRGQLESFESGCVHLREERTKTLIVAPMEAVKRANVDLNFD